jgi:hypothetical protein
VTAETAIRDDLNLAEDTIRQDLEDFAGEGVDSDDLDEHEMTPDQFAALVCGNDPWPRAHRDGPLIASMPMPPWR